MRHIKKTHTHNTPESSTGRTETHERTNKRQDPSETAPGTVYLEIRIPLY